MKTWKQGIIGILAIIALALTACDDGNGKDDGKEEPQNQTATISELFDGTYTATVKGYLTDTEWAGVADKVETLLNNAFNAGPPTGPMGALYKEKYFIVFRDDVTITVIKNPSYSKYQAEGALRELNLNYSALNTLTNGDIDTAILAVRQYRTETE